MKSRRLTFALVVTILGWASLAWVHLYNFSVPWADTWCYLGPAAAAPSPLHLISPYLSTFHHSDEAWGLHFPGSPMLCSLLLGWVPFTPSIGEFIFLALWAALAVATSLFVARFDGHAAWGALAGVAVLGDHGLFDVAQAGRPELAAALAILLLWASLTERLAVTERKRLAALCFAEFLCPLLHPVTLPVGAAVVAALILACFTPGKRWRSRAAFAALGWIAGLATLAAWFLVRPGALDQLRDHAGSRLSGFGFGAHFWVALQTLYRPLYSGHLFWMAGILFALASIATVIRSRRSADRDLAWGGLILISVLVAQEKFQNNLYLLVGFPECVALVVIGAAAWAARQPSRASRLGVIAVPGIVIALNGAFWASRTVKYVAAGRPNLRAELRAVSAQLKTRPHLLIPEVLWENFLPERAAGVNFSTLPQAASPAFRHSYETLAFGALVAGDLVVVDRFQAFAPFTVLPAAEWQLKARYTHILPGRKAWGYDLTVYEKK